MSEWISRVCAKQKTFYVPPLSHSKSSQKSNKAINRTNSYKNVLVVVVLCIIYPNTPLTMSIFFSVLAGKKIQNVHFGILRHRHILLFTRRERIPHLMDLLSKRFASHIYWMTCRHRFGHHLKRIDKFFLVPSLGRIHCTDRRGNLWPNICNTNPSQYTMYD